MRGRRFFFLVIFTLVDSSILMAWRGVPLVEYHLATWLLTHTTPEYSDHTIIRLLKACVRVR